MRSGDTSGMGCMDHSVCPGAPVPATVLVVVMNDGGYLLVGYPQDGPSAYVTAEDAVSVRQALGAAFDSEQSAGNKAAIPPRDLICKAIQP